jgi:site-specific recombinase XerD
MSEDANEALNELLAPFFSWLEKNDYSPRTVSAYSTAMRDFATWFEQTNGKELSPELLTSLDVKEYRQHLQAVRRLKATTVNSYLAGVRAYTRWAKRTDQIVQDPTNGVKSLETEDLAPRWLNRQDQHALLRAAEELAQLGALRAKGKLTYPGSLWPRRNQAIAVLLLNSGLRLSEVASLRLDDIEIRERSGTLQVRKGKGRKARTVTLNKDARSILREWLDARQHVAKSASSPHLFLSQKGGRLTPRAIARAIDKIAERAGLEDVSPHTLRHSFAKNLIDAGVGLEKVAALLGHANLETTRRYTTPSEADLQEAVERVARED